MTGLVDLDELTLLCRDSIARKYIAEAVACYNGGAYRASVVTTWIAIVFDILSKLRELELSGDHNAIAHLKRFESIRESGESRLTEALAFERRILSIAQVEFELLTPLEKEELARVQSDRNKCAHPSMQSDNEPYHPTAEIARAHIRNAVEILLAREPVQGKAALERLLGDVQSQYFPDTTDDALKHFEQGPLARAKQSVIRNFLLALSKVFFHEDKPLSERRRVRAAISAVIEMHRPRAEQVINDDLVPLIQRLQDDKLWLIIAFTANLPIVWNALGPAIQGKVQKYVMSIDESDDLLKPAIIAAIRMDGLRDQALERISSMKAENFAHIVNAHPDEVFCERAIQEFEKLWGFRWAEDYGRSAILSLAVTMNSDHIKRVLKAVESNGQIHNAGGMQEILCEFFDIVATHLPETQVAWQSLMTHIEKLDARDALGVTHSYSELKEKMVSAGIWPMIDTS